MKALLIAAMLMTASPVDSQVLVYCKDLKTQEVRIYEGFCPAGTMFVRYA